MRKIKEWLRSYGLNDTESTVYLCILEHPEIKVSDIQHLTGLVRTTIYNSLSQLKSDGLLSENLQNNVKTYRAADTKMLESNIQTKVVAEQHKLETLEELKPIFRSMQIKKPVTDSFVSRYEGIESVKQGIEEAFRCNTKRWYVIASRDNFLYHTSKQYQQYYLKERRRRNIISKTLWEPTDDFQTPSVEDVFYRNPRKLPKEFLGAFTSLVILYDDTTLIIDPYEEKTAYAVHDETSTHLLRLLFESIWRNAKNN